MKVKFKCHKCGKENEFETTGGQKLILLDNKNEGTSYYTTCKCGTQNIVTVKH